MSNYSIRKIIIPNEKDKTCTQSKFNVMLHKDN